MSETAAPITTPEQTRIPSFLECLEFAKTLDAFRREAAIRQIRSLRIFRVIAWGQQKGGKTTTLMAGMEHLPGLCVVWSFDDDNAPWDRVVPFPFPIPKKVEDLTMLRDALTVREAETQAALINGQVSMVITDTITTLRRKLKWMDDRARTDFGLNNTPQYNMQRGYGRNSICVGVGEVCFGLIDAARQSPLDSPIVLALTQHAKGLSRSNVLGDPADKNNPHNFDTRFHHWEPKISAETGRELYSMADIQMGVSLNPEPHEPDYKITLTGLHCGNRFTPKEIDIFTKVTGSQERGRFGKALRVIWALRKKTWAQAYGLSLAA